MKKIITIASLLFATAFAFAQAPEKMSYQAVIRNSSGTLLQNQNVAVKVSVLQNSETGTVVYSERVTGTTNANGLLSLVIGSGTVISGTFSSINWSSGNYYLKTETDPTGGTNYTISGTSQLLSVPYAMYAKTSGSGGSSFTLPYDGISSANNVIPFRITNTSETLNSAGYFENTNSSNSSAAVMGINNSTGSFGAGVMGRANSNTNGNMSAAVSGNLQGSGDSGAGVYGYATNAYGVYGNTGNGYGVAGYASGTGSAGYFFSTSTAKALSTYGVLKFMGIGEGAGKVLTSDASGNATWQTPTSTNNQWLTSGTNIINTNTGNVGINAATPSEKFTVKINSKGISQESLDGSVKVGFYTDNFGAFIQTHSNHDLNFSTGNGQSKLLLQKDTGNFGIGTTTPTEKLEVDGKTKTTNFQMTNGAASGRILKSDASGNASWVDNGSESFIAKKPTAQTFTNNGLPVEVLFNDSTADTGVTFGSSRFTANYYAKHQFNVSLSLANNTGVAFNNYIVVGLWKYASNGTATLLQSYYVTGNGSTSSILPSVSFSTILNLSVGDVVGVRLENFSTTTIIVDGGAITGSTRSSFTGFRIK